MNPGTELLLWTVIAAGMLGAAKLFEAAGESDSSFARGIGYLALMAVALCAFWMGLRS